MAQPRHDFYATIRIYTPQEGGRRTPACNGLRWDFAYADEPAPATLYMIWPDFLSTGGEPPPADAPLPVGVELAARMRIITPERNAEAHRARLTPGVQFFCHEGNRRVAAGVVTSVPGPCQPNPAPGKH